MSSSEAQISDNGSGDLMSALMANAQVVRGGESSSSPCEKQCRTEQAAIVECIEGIRSARESDGSNTTATDSSSDPAHSSGKVECLAPVVAAWTKCCSDANNSSND
mmetsp:Transcript_14199/g.30814  ORF Transcript_14199/g.30814 Transcript_14199/m.30814 type:complete len:106 (-) Transcript_14199:438-755(-)